MISDKQLEDWEHWTIGALNNSYEATCSIGVKSFAAILKRLRAAEKERDQLREWQAYMRSPHSPIRNDTIEQCAKVCRETRGTKTLFSFYDTGDRELGCEQCEEAILALKETP